MMAACYSMDLYCDIRDSTYITHGYQEFPHNYIGETFGECKKQAQQTGWTFTRDGKHICPKHSGKRK